MARKTEETERRSEVMNKIQARYNWQRTGEYTELGEPIYGDTETGDRAVEKDNRYLVVLKDGQ